MLNQLKTSAKSGALKFIQATTVVGTTLFITLSVNANPSSKAVQKEIAEIFKKNPDKQIVVKVENEPTNEETAIEMLGGNDSINALDFAVQNVDKYYPDMKVHLQEMINQFGTDKERKNVVDSIFNQTIGKITDPKQRIGATIYGLEAFVFRESEFGDKHDSDITDATFNIIETAQKQYNTRLKKRIANISKINEELEKSKQELEKSKQELEKINQKLRNNLNKVTVQDVKNNEQIKNMVIQTKEIFKKYNTPTNSKHIDELFKLIP